MRARLPYEAAVLRNLLWFVPALVLMVVGCRPEAGEKPLVPVGAAPLRENVDFQAFQDMTAKVFKTHDVTDAE